MPFAIRKFILLPVALMLPLFHAAATTIQYTSVSTWRSNVTNPFELDFSKIASVNYNTASGKTLYPLSGTQVPFVVTGPYSGGYQLAGGGYTTNNYISLFGPTNGSGSITITLPTGGENALMLGLGTIGSATSLTVTLSDNQTFNVPVSGPSQLEFFGVSLSHDVSWLTITSSSQSVLDDFYFGTSKLSQDAAPTSEVATFLMFGGGLVAMYGARRKLFPAAPAA